MQTMCFNLWITLASQGVFVTWSIVTIKFSVKCSQYIIIIIIKKQAIELKDVRYSLGIKKFKTFGGSKLRS